MEGVRSRPTSTCTAEQGCITSFTVKLKVVLFVVAVCLVIGSTSTTNETQVRGHALGIPPVADRSLVAIVKEGQQLAIHISSETNAIADRTTDRTMPSKESERVWSENRSPQPQKVKLKRTSGENQPNVKMSAIEMLHLLKKGQTPEQARILKSQLRDTFFSGEGGRPFIDLFLGRNVKGDTNYDLSEKLNPGRQNSPSRMRRGNQKSPPASNNNGSNLTDEMPSVQLPTSASTKTLTNKGQTTLPLVPIPSSPTSEVTSTTAPSDFIPDKTSIQLTSEPAAPVTTEPDFSNTSPSNIKTSAYPQVLQTSKLPTSPPKSTTKDYQTTTLSDNWSPSLTSPLPATNRSTPPGSKIQEVQERTSGSECANGNCNQGTNDVYWAFGSLLTVLLLLTACVLYTGLWRKRNHMSNPISDVSCHAQASPSKKGKTDMKELIKKKLCHIKNLNSSPLSSSGKAHSSKHNGSTTNSSNGRASNRHRYDRLPLLVGDDEEEEFSKEWGLQTNEHSV